MKAQNSEVTQFKVKRRVRLGLLFRMFCERQALKRADCRFLFDGLSLFDHDTVADAKLESGDIIDAVQCHTGC